MISNRSCERWSGYSHTEIPIWSILLFVRFAQFPAMHTFWFKWNIKWTWQWTRRKLLVSRLKLMKTKVIITKKNKNHRMSWLRKCIWLSDFTCDRNPTNLLSSASHEQFNLLYAFSMVSVGWMTLTYQDHKLSLDTCQHLSCLHHILLHHSLEVDHYIFLF